MQRNLKKIDEQSFFDGHTHRTVYNGGVSSTMLISARIVQGSSLGSASYAADLKPLHADNPVL